MKQFFIFLTMLLSTNAVSESFTLESGKNRIPLVELYTSQGCSSCPPAEKWFSTLVQDQRLWRTIVPINFHVDYWDSLGWPDEYASPVFTTRQRVYKQRGASSTVATPGFIVNGVGWNGWFYGKDIPELSSIDVGNLKATISNNRVDIVFNATHHGLKNLHVNVSRLGFGLFNKIPRGENRGKVLRHDFVALSFQRSPLRKTESTYHASIILPTNEIDNALNGIALWVTQENDPTPIQSVGGYVDF